MGVRLLLLAVPIAVVAAELLRDAPVRVRMAPRPCLKGLRWAP